ncbi:pyridoxal phosphate-dependent aminotransferase [Pseudohongiella sp. SYSU M77423]|uniref:pyridoxal phosphate-dependent aminotransferase n=1 Tax=Pseudohongiella sp. SYSU M77423 TaxID=3042312 RepID=UPI002480BBED|nr:pyridoxal phosphate-dependent aminotransferase [Pseudohongiella sp. SYSU M77423]MDH7943227.1 pyridoxal phosphate-dependent aminotransferase [Pseudohongiella sp. SYSU M77423]MEC8860951.1 pyridoxal phosphate-dependent aminotransferase [Pseudomonadota bacterium]
MKIGQSDKLAKVCYDIRGPVLEVAKQLEEEGNRILKLNIGNPAPFGFEAPDEILQDVIRNLSNAQGYSDSKGLFSARKAIMQECQQLGIDGVDIDDIYLGNGVSELIVMAMQALLNNGDEVLVPAPDYPLWTAAVSLAGGNPVHYICDEQADWFPDIADIEKKITPKTRAMVIINPNNPTGAVYSPELLLDLIRVARKHKLIIFSDEIYSKILYDDAVHTPIASLCDDLFIVTFNGLSKSYRLAGFRSGWMILSGAREQATGYIEGLEILSNMRLCANVPAQFAVQTALGGYQSINELIIPGGRLRDQRDAAYNALISIPGVSCVKPKGAIYMFPKLDPSTYSIIDDQQFILELLEKEKILLVQGSAFNIEDTQHLRIVFLPTKDVLQQAMDKIERFLSKWAQSH